jgi:hypothetical protein
MGETQTMLPYAPHVPWHRTRRARRWIMLTTTLIVLSGLGIIAYDNWDFLTRARARSISSAQRSNVIFPLESNVEQACAEIATRAASAGSSGAGQSIK